MKATRMRGIVREGYLPMTVAGRKRWCRYHRRLSQLEGFALLTAGACAAFMSGWKR